MNKKNIIKGFVYATTATLSIHFLNKLIFYKSTTKNKLFEIHKHYYNWRYGKIFYTVKGEGKPLLLVHGIGIGLCGSIYKDIVDELSKYYKVYSIDLLGFGRSDKPQLVYTAYLYVQLLCDFIENVIKSPTNIIADSLSCSFVIMCNQMNKNLFNKIILINPLEIKKLNKYPNKLSNITRKLYELPIFGTLIFNILSSKIFIRKHLKKYGFYNNRKISKKLVDTIYESAHLGGSNAKFAIASYKNYYMNINITKALSSIDNSLYIIQSKNIDNKNTITKLIENYIQINPSIEYSIIENTKSLLFMEKSKDFNEICKFFF